MGLGVYYRTACHLRWSQLLWRVRYARERRRPVSPRAAARWRWSGGRPPRLREDFPDVPLPRGREPEQATVSGPDSPDWRLGAVATDRLRTITLHYHAWAYPLAERAGDAFRQHLADWMRRCALEAPGARELAWNAYAIATRLTWWVRSYRLLGSDRWRGWGTFHDDFLASLWQQAAYLRDHLEWDLRANHLLRDAVGLAWAGRFFAEDRAREWLEAATRLAVSQADEQVLPDGGHFERSPMYHLHVMEDFLSLALLVEDPKARGRLRDSWAAMAEFLAWLRHPDGDLVLFNDGGLPGAPTVEHMLGLGSRLGVETDAAPRRGGRHFPDTGLVAWHGEPWAVFFDVGPAGPDYQPGHAHADTLTVECSYRGRRLFVDPGTYAYDLDDRRRYDRSTAAHNTVCVDGQDSSEAWHIFRVGRRAYPRDVRVEFTGGGVRAAAAHTGYDHLPGRPRHRRRLEVGGGRLTLTDRVEGRGRHRVEGGWLLGPEWAASPAGGGWVLTDGPRTVRVSVQGSEGLKLYEERRPYHPGYGRELETTRLGWRREGDLPAEVETRVEGD
jgi:hypothetical protein